MNEEKGTAIKSFKVRFIAMYYHVILNRVINHFLNSCTKHENILHLIICMIHQLKSCDEKQLDLLFAKTVLKIRESVIQFRST